MLRHARRALVAALSTSVALSGLALVASAAPAASAAPSVAAAGCTSAKIQVRTASDDALRGYVGLSSGIYSNVAAASASTFSVAYGAGVNITDVAAASTTPNLGMVAGQSGATLSASGPGYTLAARTSTTASGAAPTAGTSTWTSGGQVESAVWNVDAATGAAVPTWINPGGAAAPGILFVSRGQLLGMSGNLASTGSAYGDTLVAVRLQVVCSTAQTVVFTSTAPSSARVGGTTYTARATGGASGNPVTFTSGTPATCTVAGSTVSFVGAGTCTVRADQTAGNGYDAAAQVQQSFTVAQGVQAITFTSTPSATSRVGDTYPVSATGGASGQPVSFSSTTPTVCSVSGATVTYLATGACTVAADQAGTTAYAAAPRVTQGITVVKGLGSVAITSTAPTAAKVAGGTYDVTTRSGPSSAPVVVSSATPAVCTVSGATASFLRAGPCTVQADQAGDASFTAAATAGQSFDVGKGAGSVSITSPAPTTARVAGDGYDVTTRPGASSAAVELSTTTPDVCTVTGATVTFVGVGSCTVQADQAGDDDYEAATSASQSFHVAKGAGSVSITSTAPTAARVGGTAYDVTTQGGPSSADVAVSSTTPAVCTVSGSRVSLVGVGTCTVQAEQATDALYDAATDVQSFDVAQGEQAIGFTSAAPTSAHPGDHYDVAATGGASGSAVTFTSATPTVCTVTDASVTFAAAGTCTVLADQAGTADYEAAPQASQDVVVTQVASTVVVGTASNVVTGQDTTVTADVAVGGEDADGTVQFAVDGTDLGAPVAVASGTATSPSYAGAAGDHAITAAFTPTDAARYAGSSGSGTLSVGKAATGTTVATDGTNLTAAVTAVAPGAGTPTGTVVFRVDGTQVGSAALSQGSATLPYAVPSGSSHGISAEYAGDAGYEASSGSTSRHDPTITAKARGTRSILGWYRSRVTVTYTCTTNGAPLVGTCPAPVVLGRNGAQSVTRSVSAADGGIDSVTTRVSIDRSLPTVKLGGVRANGRYFGTNPDGVCSGTDSVTGVVSCTVKITGSAGTRHTMTATAADRAGNVSRTSRSYDVVRYAIEGASFTGGRWNVRKGETYTLLVASSSRPRYVDAGTRSPSGLDTFFVRSGDVAGTKRWTLGVTMSMSTRSTRSWVLGVLDHGTVRLLPVRVSG